jgi:hypothetical protein
MTDVIDRVKGSSLKNRAKEAYLKSLDTKENIEQDKMQVKQAVLQWCFTVLKLNMDDFKITEVNLNPFHNLSSDKPAYALVEVEDMKLLIFTSLIPHESIIKRTVTFGNIDKEVDSSFRTLEELGKVLDAIAKRPPPKDVGKMIDDLIKKRAEAK